MIYKIGYAGGENMRIFYIGCVESSYIELELLLENHKNVVGVITKKKSDFNADFCDLKPLAEKYGVRWKYVDNINEKQSVEFIKDCKPDVIYCFGWSQLIKKDILDIPPLGVIGTHPTELPQNRGRHPIIWSLVLGLEYTAATFFQMDEGADSGKIISQKRIKIEYTDYARDLYNKIIESECEQILEFTNAFESGNCIGKEQNKDEGNSWRKRGEADGTIDWRMSSRAIYNLVRALSHPYVGAQFIYKDQKYKVWRVEELDGSMYKNIEPGKIVNVNSARDFSVKAYDNLIHVLDCDDFEAVEGAYL